MQKHTRGCCNGDLLHATSFSSIMICRLKHRSISAIHQLQTVKALKADAEHGVVKHQQLCRSMFVASDTVSQQMNL